LGEKFQAQNDVEQLQ